MVDSSCATIDAASSASRIENAFFSPIEVPSARSICTPSEWKVDTSGVSAPFRRVMRPSRSAISLAALLVKVIAPIARGVTPPSSRCTIFCVITRVLPEPAPAMTRHGPSR